VAMGAGPTHLGSTRIRSAQCGLARPAPLTPWPAGWLAYFFLYFLFL